MSTTLTVTFDRIGRNRNVPPLTVAWDPAKPEDTADAVLKYASPRLASRGVEVVLNVDDQTGAGTGMILAGFHNGGTFRIEPAGSGA